MDVFDIKPQTFKLQEGNLMKNKKILLMLVVVPLLLSSATLVAASDFDWTRDFNMKAEVDPSGFIAKLSAQFEIGEAQVRAVLRDVQNPADAYMVFRLGKISSKSPDYVVQKYKSERKKGWGAVAKSLGVKPGSQEFHALKAGSDFDDSGDKGKGKKKNKDKGKKKG